MVVYLFKLVVVLFSNGWNSFLGFGRIDLPIVQVRMLGFNQNKRQLGGNLPPENTYLFSETNGFNF